MREKKGYGMSPARAESAAVGGEFERQRGGGDLGT